ncbi:MAG: DoxX family protein [Flavobacteriaceae bacterium]|jgi:uncharacterized membrane protein YphA (DoxX/SURF4 family)|nr:DoxX family protein [Flavobacteriaceae bacterium]MDG2289821.1 DoxX family protein [Flavobacteriaceae bacterium]
MKTTLHTILTILLALFFIYKGVDKIPIKVKSITQEEIIETIIERGSYEAPVGYKITMNTMRQSGFLRLIAFFQIIAGILMIIPRTRLAGLLFLLPMIFNIFFMHVFFDNRIDENILTGSLLALNLLLCSYYYKRIQLILLEKNK